MAPPLTAQPLDRRPARLLVYDELRSWIENNSLAPGEVIRDVEIAGILGVSRTPVREALQMLERDHLVEVLPGRRTRVTELNVDDVALAYPPLAALQALAAELGTPAATSDDIREMRQHNELMLAAIGKRDAPSARSADRSFHDVLVRLAANRYLDSAIRPLYSQTRRLEAVFFDDDLPGRTSYAQHKRIIAAVAAGDAAAAAEHTRLNWDIARVTAALRGQGPARQEGR